MIAFFIFLFLLPMIFVKKPISYDTILLLMNVLKKEGKKALMKKENIVLTGMPASGKSTVGVILAKILGMDYIDTDLVIQKREGAKLSEIIEKEGTEGFLKAEEQAILSVDVHNTVIATGGSVIYSNRAMEHLSDCSKIVYLKVGKEEILKRLKDISERGVVLRPGESVEDMYDSRSVLYEQYADITVFEDGFTIEDTVRAVRQAFS